MKLLKGQKSLFRYTGILASTITLVQACIWMLFSLFAVGYFLHNDRQMEGSTVAAIFHNMYFSRAGGTNFPTMPAIYIHGFMWFYFILSSVWFILSFHLIKVFCQWSDIESIRKRTLTWIIITIIVCVSDLALFIVFVIDFRHIIQTYTSKGDKYFKNLNLESDRYSSRRMGFYLEDNLEALKAEVKRLEKLKEELIENPSKIDERNPFVITSLRKRWRGSHIDNPFLASESSRRESDVRVTVRSTESLFMKSKARVCPTDEKIDDNDDDYLVKLTMLNRLVFAPGIMMSIVARGYFIWFMNIGMAFYVLYLYIARANWPTLITRIQR